MKPNTLFANAVIGMIVTKLLDAGFRVEVSDQDGGGLFIYAQPHGEEITKPCDYWVALHLDNDPCDIVNDYSVNLEKVLAPVNSFCDSLDK